MLHALLAAYGDDARRYHDQTHLLEVLGRIDEIVADPSRGDAPGATLRLAAFFHDAVYGGRPADGHRSDAASDEEASAQWAERALAGRLPHEQVAVVADLVRATADHRAGALGRDAAVLLDADLGILAADHERYAAYAEGVRAEYAHVPSAAFAAGRSAILRDLLQRDRLFLTDHAHREWEQAARANVGRELRELERLSR